MENTIDLVDIEIVEDPNFVDAKYCLFARFVKDKGAWDKSFSFAHDKLKLIRDRAGYQITCVMSVEDPTDLENLNTQFKHYRG